MIDDAALSRASKRLSWLLRHGANESGLAMDTAGWSRVDDVLRLAKLSREELEQVVARNTKSRLELDREGDRVRASQGHSLAGTPVTREGLEASWQACTDDASVWHGTHLDAVASIAREGLLPGERTHVHLAEGLASKVGKRANVDVMLEVSPARLRAAGLALYRSPNGVLLARRVPPGCVVGLEPVSRRARADAARLRALFDLPRPAP